MIYDVMTTSWLDIWMKRYSCYVNTISFLIYIFQKGFTEKKFY